VSTAHLDQLVGGLARVHDDDLAGENRSAEAREIFERIVSEPMQEVSRRRPVVLVAVVAAALVAAPALALHGRIAHLFGSGDEAPPLVAASFLDLQQGAPPAWRIASSARLVHRVPTPDGSILIWAAPREVGFCYAVGIAGHDGFASTCTDGSEAVDAWPFTVTKRERIGGSFALVGFSSDRQARAVEIRSDDGVLRTVPLAWVSAPINAGFFAVPTAKTQWLDGKERFQITALDGSGDAVATSVIEVGVPTG
jgi:hypothetical protein